MRRIELFGALRVSEEERIFKVKGGRAVSLLAYLALHSHARHGREALAEILSPDAAPERVRRNLSDALYRLRCALGAGWLDVEGETVALRVGSDLWVDVWEFERLAARTDLAALEAAAALYKGDLLPEIYDDWILLPRLSLQDRYLSILETLMTRYEAQNELPRALSYARQLIAADPLRESGHQSYLRLLGRLKRRAQALVHYEYVRQLFRAQLGVEPLAETQALAEAIRREAESAPAAPPVSERTRFVGRTVERSLGVERIEQALAGQGGLLGIEGEAGIGKSRLLRELATSAQWRGAAAAYAAASEYPGASPFSPLADALRPLLRSGRASHLETLLPPETLAALAPLYEPWRATATLSELPPTQARQRFHDSFVALMQALARLAPLVLLLDDLHWADAALWDLLDALAPRVSASPLLLLLAYRRPEVERNPGWETLRRWERTGHFQTIALKPLDVQEVAQLLPKAERSDAARVTALTGGNPFYVTEYLNREGDAAGQDPIRTRLGALSASARAALEAAAVLGEQAPFRLWSMVAGESPLALAAAGEELTNRIFVQPTDAGCAFVHDVIRAAVYDATEPERRRLLHARGADALAALDPENWRARAFHLERGGRATEAAEAYRQAGAQASAQFAFREAQVALARALALQPNTPSVERVETALAFAQACDVLGERERGQAALEEALRGARALQHESLTLQALLASGRLAARMGRMAEAGAWLDEAMALAQRSGDARQEFEAVFWRGDLAARRGNLAAAKAAYARALEVAQRASHLPGQGRALRGLGNVARMMGEPEQAIPLLEQAVALQRRTGDRYAESVTLTNVLAALYDLGAWDRLLTLTADALALAESLGDRLVAAIERHMQGLAAYALGDWDTARAVLPRVIEECEAAGDRRTAGLAMNVLGLVEGDAGNPAQARAWCERALARALAIEAATEAAYARHDLGVLLLALDEPAAACEALEAARATWQAQGNELLRLKTEAYLGLALLALSERQRAQELADAGLAALRQAPLRGEQPQAWLWALHRLLSELGRPADAEDALAAAYREVQRQGLAIADPAMRRNFFERVPLNRAILAAHDALAPTLRRMTVALARRDAPLGRALTEAERVTIQWTLHAPEDDAIRSKTVRRRHRLRRLLAEAEAQNAAPTDDDLARALGVSRYTILRDMAALAQSGHLLRTRRRKTT
ncbi:AAA family ATPase [Caldilinea sp.]|uniref:ATP-binding protein n=1 Tax=Caldilinea sp. TaxID=2293560 RepID=UPI0021DB811B|nr:AAA family ATPase [Caldilinea sp.]GIV69776.1 MAG: transcriptional activator [Caldilinea sp.]